MLLKQDSIFATVKFKITFLYVVLLLVSSVFLMAAVEYLLFSNLIVKTDNELISLANILEHDYIEGGDEDAFENVNHIEDIPDFVIQTAKAKINGITIKRVLIEKLNGVDMYDVGASDGQRFYEIKVSFDGKVLDVESQELLKGADFLAKSFRAKSYYFGSSKVYFRLLSKTGEDIVHSDMARWLDALDEHTDFITSNIKQEFKIIKNKITGEQARLIHRRLEDDKILEIAIDISEQNEFLSNYGSIFIYILLAQLLVGSGIGWYVSGRAMRGVLRVVDTANSIDSADFSKTVPVGNEGSEISELVIAFNNMLSRIHLLLKEQQEVADNIAHDLRTPITRIRGIIETTVNTQPTIEAYREMSADVVEECDRLLIIVNTMLEITQTKSSLIKLDLEELDLVLLLQKAVQMYRPVAESLGINLIFESKIIACSIMADRQRLQRVFSNIIDNALKYSGNSNVVKVCVYENNNQVVVNIKDNGCGIASENLVHVFDRFYRCDQSRHLPGNGLGLSLVEAIIKAHGGECVLKSILNQGTECIVMLKKESHE